MQKISVKVATVVFAGMVLAVCSACSFSASSRSSSASSRSSSRSGGGDRDEEHDKEPAKVKELESAHTGFQEEIAAIAVLYVGSSGSAEDFQRDITAGAKRNGIPYWELDARVFTAIGVGLKRAGIKKEDVSSLPFLQGLRNAAQFNAIGNAYGK